MRQFAKFWAAKIPDKAHWIILPLCRAWKNVCSEKNIGILNWVHHQCTICIFTVRFLSLIIFYEKKRGQITLYLDSERQGFYVIISTWIWSWQKRWEKIFSGILIFNYGKEIPFWLHFMLHWTIVVGLMTCHICTIFGCIEQLVFGNFSNLEWYCFDKTCQNT